MHSDKPSIYSYFMILKIKYLFLNIDTIISKSFFYSQSRFTYVLRDFFFIKFYRLTKKFYPLKGSNNSPIPKINENEFSSRSNASLAKYSVSYEINEIPEIIKSIIAVNKKNIEDYLGKGFCYEPPIIFRNFNFPKEFSSFDVYSNIWHQDSFNGNRLLKIFILLNKVSESDGPFHYLDPDLVKLNWAKIRDRWSFESQDQVLSITGELRLTGDKGDYLIIDTSVCTHRASIPSNYRDILQITLLPKWKKNSRNNHYK